jgi:hypothetical protein
MNDTCRQASQFRHFLVAGKLPEQLLLIMAIPRHMFGKWFVHVSSAEKGSRGEKVRRAESRPLWTAFRVD